MTRTHTRAFLLALALLLFAGSSAQAQTNTGAIRGAVTDSTDGSPLPGVNVVIQGTQQGSSTGADGTYTIAGLEPGTYTLQASFVGFDTKSITGVQVASGDTVQVDIALSSGAVGLDEVVVIGYGTQQREDVTGSISTVEGEEISRIPTSSATQALQGQVSGVQVTPNSGAPGASATVRIRGVGTTGDASPLYVVDGVLTDDISYLSTSDIQSMSVLKDASATAIYGSRGANGVIVVTTKKGTLGEGTTFSFDAYYGWQSVMDEIALTDGPEYAMLANEVAANADQELPFDDPSSVTTNTDWQDRIYRTAPMQNYQLSARGGTEDITYSFSSNFIREEGILPKSDFSRATFRLNNTYALSGAIELGHNIAFTYRQGTDPNGGLIGSTYRADPTLVPTNDEGEFNPAIRTSAGNPAASLNFYNNSYTGRRLVGNVYVEATFLDHFTLRSDAGVDLNQEETKGFTPQFFISPQQRTERSTLTIGEEEDGYWQWENTLTYERELGDHEFDVLGGVTAQEFTSTDIGGTRFNLPGESENLWYLNAGEEDGQQNESTATDWAILSGLGRVNYSYLNRYLLTASIRADGSSRFGENNRWGYFPSFAAGWRISEEPFMDAAGAISNLKLRASWGITGNDKIGEYPGIPVVEGNLSAVLGAGTDEGLQFGATPTTLANPDVRWEETRQTGIGLEIGLLDSRLSAEIDYYRRTTDGILLTVPIPEYVGASPPVINAAEVLNTGFDLSVNWTQNVADFSYGLGATASTINNEVQALGQGQEALLGGGYFGVPFTTRTVPGQPIGVFYGYRVAGIFQTPEEVETLPSRGVEAPGDLRYEDIDGDGEITDADRTFIGSPIPDFVYGFNLNLGYRGLDLTAQFSGQTGNKIFNVKKAARFATENFEESALDRWTGPGTSTTEPRVTNGGHNFEPSEYLLEDGSFFKLRNVQLGYALPSRLTSAVRVQSARVYVNGTNLFTVTDYSGYTPEIPNDDELASGIDDGVYPVARTVTFGVQTTF